MFKINSKKKYVLFENTHSYIQTPLTMYSKFPIILENFVFANIREFDPSRIQDSCETIVNM